MSGLDLSIKVGTPSYPVLDAYRRDNSRVSIIMGPLGSGKTYASVQRLLRHMVEQQPTREGIRPTRWLCIRNTYGDLEKTTIVDFLKLFGQLGEMLWSTPPTFTMKVALQDGTFAQSEVIFLALDRPEASETRLRGLNVTGAWLNETKELVKPVLDMARFRAGRFPLPENGGVWPTWRGVFGDSNAWDEDHWLWKLAEENTPEGWRFFRQPGGVIKVDGRWVENPNAENLRNLVPGYYKDGLGGMSDDWISVNLANEYGFTIDGKPVHPAYVDSVHCTREPIPFDSNLPILLGIDYGRTPAAAIAQHIPQWGRTVVIDEFVTEDMSAADFGPALRRYLGQHYPGPVKGWSDPAGDASGQATNDTPRQVVVAAGIPVQSAPTNDPTLRRAAVSRPLQRMAGDKPALLISPKAKTIRKGLAGGFCYRRLKVAGTERYTEIPDKNYYSHVCFSAGTPIATESGEIGVERIRVGDFVSTPLGPRRVTHTHSRVADVIEVAGLRVTPDHPFATPAGWVRAEAVEYANAIRREDPAWKQRLFLRSVRHGRFGPSSSLMGCGTIGSRLATTKRSTAPISIARSGWLTTARFLMGITSTIATETAAIIGSRILSASMGRRTSPGTCRERRAEIGRAGQSAQRSKVLRSGVSATRNEHQRLVAAVKPDYSRLVVTPDLLSCFVPIAKAPLPSIGSNPVARSSARSRALPQLASLVASTTKTGSALNAEPDSAATGTSGTGPAPGAARVSKRQERVYAITVDDAHCYYAGGFLVSNCEALEYLMLGLGEGVAALRRPDYDDREPLQDTADFW